MEDNMKPKEPKVPEIPKKPEQPAPPSGVNMNRMNVELQGDKPENQVISVTPKRKHSESTKAFEANLPKNLEIAQAISKPQGQMMQIGPDLEQAGKIGDSGFVSDIAKANEAVQQSGYEQMPEGEKFMRGFVSGLGLGTDEIRKMTPAEMQKSTADHDKALKAIEDYYGDLERQYNEQRQKVADIKRRSQDPKEKLPAKEYAEASMTLEAMKREILKQNKVLQERKRQLEVSRNRIKRLREADSGDRIRKMFNKQVKGTAKTLGKIGRVL